MSTYDDVDDAPSHTYDSTRPHSIDLSLELERQLEIDSLPNSPVVAENRKERPQSLDPHVLASIVTQLRLSLSEVTKERDELSTLLAEAQARETDLKEALHTVSERCLKTESELAAALEKGKEDQDAVSMLRGKLEDSRRALMRLQTENRRSSMALDLSRAGPSSFNASVPSRRTSFAPLTGSPGGRINAHRRISSVSEPGYADHNQWGSPPGTARLEPLQLLSNTASAPAAPASQNPRRISGFFGRTTPTPPDLPTTEDASELEELRKELQAVKEQLEETRNELTEAKEGQEASETCANALRTFIAENSLGLHAPGRNADPTPPAESANKAAAGTRWGFKLWNTPSTANTPATSPGIQNAPAPAAIGAAAAPPLTRKIGGFFSSRSSFSSTASATRPEPLLHQQEPMCNGSDSSSVDSVAEPVSPASELPEANILVQSFDGGSAELTHSPEQTKRVLEDVDIEQRMDSAV